MKYILSFLVFLISQQINAQLTVNVNWTEQTSLPASEICYYNPARKLAWENFRGTPPAVNSQVAALTVSGFGYNASVKTINGKGQLTVNVYCYFSKEKSWVRPGKNTDYILSHEQHHFDVSYIAAAIFIDKLQGTKFTTANFNAVLNSLYRESCDIMNKMQNDYDGQTKNGQLKEQQAKWNELIDSRVASLTK